MVSERHTVMKVFLGTIVAAGLAAAPSVGVKYGSREPAICQTMKDPAKGPPSAEQVRRYVLCGAEGEKGRTLYLLQDVKVEVGKGAAYRDIPPIHRPGNADPEGLVYQIRGSLKRYQCEPHSTSFPNAGKNCRLYDEPKATGECHKDNFGDWQCSLRDLDSPDKYGTADQPPPKN
jgi:hypothetical protein